MIWDVRLDKALVHGERRFSIALAFASGARRLALVGPSGAGKTQTLRMMAGITRPDAGLVSIGARVLYDSAGRIDLAPQARRLGYVFQDYALFPHLTVRQNIGFGRWRGWRNPARGRPDPAVARWIASFHLDGVADHYPHQISGGQRQRTALARALVNDPLALLLDEPFAALDTGLRRRLRAELRDVQRDLALPTLLISHDDDDAGELADDVVAMHDGRVVDDLGVVEAVDAAAL